MEERQRDVLLELQIARLGERIGDIKEAAAEVRHLRRVAYGSDEETAWNRLWTATEACAAELWWLKERLARVEEQQASELNRIVDLECKRRQQALAFRSREPEVVAVRRDPQRLFSPLQKQEIYLRSNGQCGACGMPLDSDWHADHVVPHARGGRTELVNAQALCQPRNQRKSAKVLTVDE